MEVRTDSAATIVVGHATSNDRPSRLAISPDGHTAAYVSAGRLLFVEIP